MRKGTILLLLILLLIPQIGLTAENKEQTKAPFTIEAEDYVIFDEETETIDAAGNVEIKTDTDSIKADRVQIDLTTKVIKATGNVLLVQGEQKIEGTGLEYNYETEKGKFYNSKMKQDKIKFKGKKINISQDKMVIEDTSFTPCTHEVPHYKVTSEKIRIYPDRKEDNVIAEDNHLWVNGKEIMALPKYVTSTNDKEREKNAIPEPKVGYGSDEGFYIGLDYDHYVNEKLDGHVYAQAATKEGNQLELDYNYHPNESTEFIPRINYDQRVGLSTYLQLKNEFGDHTTSNLQYNSYWQEIEDDGDEGETYDDHYDYEYDQKYKQEWYARWDLSTQIAKINTDLFLGRDHESDELEEKIKLQRNWSDYYWQVMASQHMDVDYQPQYGIGIKNKDLGQGILLSASAKTGDIDEEDTGVRTARDQFKLELKDNKVELTDNSSLYWSGEVTKSNYGTGDQYKTYDVNLGTNHQVAGLDINLDYQHYNELGTTPFDFDDLTEDNDQLGTRDYVTASIGDSLDVTEQLAIDWNISGGRTFYETGEEYDNYGVNTGLKYQIDDYNQLEVDYNYLGLAGKSPLEDDRDKYELSNELVTRYNFKTNESKFPYWDVGIEVGYEFNDEELSELNYSVKREYDCFSTEISFDQLEEKVDFGIDFKY